MIQCYIACQKCQSGALPFSINAGNPLEIHMKIFLYFCDECGLQETEIIKKTFEAKK